MKKPSVGIVMGSESDWPTLKDAAHILKKFKIPFTVSVVSAHRTPEKMLTYVQDAEFKNVKVIIAGAGGSAHLPGMLASYTVLPVIGVPVMTKSLQGIDSLLSIVQMPKGIPVATVAIDNSTNAALLALRILAANDQVLTQKLKKYQSEMKTAVQLMNKKIRKNSRT